MCFSKNSHCDLDLGPRTLKLELVQDIVILDTHTCDIFLEPDREIWDFSEGDWGLR